MVRKELEDAVYRSIYWGVGIFAVLWVSFVFGFQQHLLGVSPALWSIILWCLCVISALYGVYCVFRLLTMKRSKAEWFARSGIVGEFALQQEAGGYFSRIRQYTSTGEEENVYIVRFLWIGDGGSRYTAELPVEKIFLNVKEFYEGPPLVRFWFRDMDAPEPFTRIRPRVRQPTWWLKREHAEELGFLYAQITIGKEDYREELVRISFPPSHVR
jgi:hypothetical protein